ncbi:hypothetical protein HYFRA_00004729 [Hymenoscyphus fraxineus]|uniref:Rhodopsin domain-containing protein n=1 Tax=Hymenoscyphus fraxineus TaxID=746836 RepID=A0A9N9KWL7_9HELO|nr:hypothetical protein HYFRA_00004729 [Hymenoscyphus fraxineus]
MVNIKRDTRDLAVPDETWDTMSNLTLVGVPPGVSSDISHRKWHGRQAIVAAGTVMPIMIILSFVRIYAKCWRNRKWTTDDSIFLSSLVAALILTSNQIAQVISGGIIGFHAWEIRVKEVTKTVMILSLVVSILTGPLIWIIKLTLFCLIYNTFHPLKYVRRLVYIGIVVSGLYYTGAAIIQGVYCGPKGGTDRKAMMVGFGRESCIFGEMKALTISMGAVNVFFDFYILILPLPAIYRLQMERRKKIGVFFMFLTGIGTCVMSIVNLYYRVHLSYSHDFNYETVPFMTVSSIEHCVGVVIPCMPQSAKTFGRVYTHLKSHFITSSRSFRCTFSTIVSTKQKEENFARCSPDIELKRNSHTQSYDKSREDEDTDLNPGQQPFSNARSVLYSSSTADSLLPPVELAAQTGWNDDTIKSCL